MKYPLTIKALAIFDAHATDFERFADAALTDKQWAFVEHVELMRRDYVRQAFLADTADRNRWTQVRVMPIADIREVVAKIRTTPLKESLHHD